MCNSAHLWCLGSCLFVSCWLACLCVSELKTYLVSSAAPLGLSIMPGQVNITAGWGNHSPASAWNDILTLNINASYCLTSVLSKRLMHSWSLDLSFYILGVSHSYEIKNTDCNTWNTAITSNKQLLSRCRPKLLFFFSAAFCFPVSAGTFVYPGMHTSVFFTFCFCFKQMYPKGFQLSHTPQSLGYAVKNSISAATNCPLIDDLINRKLIKSNLSWTENAEPLFTHFNLSSLNKNISKNHSFSVFRLIDQTNRI